jgi:hypothetical protein
MNPLLGGALKVNDDIGGSLMSKLETITPFKDEKNFFGGAKVRARSVL